MEKILIIIFSVIVILSIIIGAVFAITSGYQNSKDQTYERSLAAPEVIAFHERYDNVTKFHMDLNSIIYDAIDENGNYITLNFYAGNVPPTPRTSIHCSLPFNTAENNTELITIEQYTINEDVLNFVQNYNCFEEIVFYKMHILPDYPIMDMNPETIQAIFDKCEEYAIALAQNLPTKNHLIIAYNKTHYLDNNFCMWINRD